MEAMVVWLLAFSNLVIPERRVRRLLPRSRQQPSDSLSQKPARVCGVSVMRTSTLEPASAPIFSSTTPRVSSLARPARLAKVKLYHCVTLGARSFAKDDSGQLVRGTKRHPDVEDNVHSHPWYTAIDKEWPALREAFAQ